MNDIDEDDRTDREASPGAVTLTPAERQALKARAHLLAPVIMIGTGGVTDPVVGEIDRALARHGLIKIRVLGDDRDARAAMLDEICARTGAAPVQHIGKILVVYRPLPPEAPSAAKAKADVAAKKRAKPKPALPRRVLGRAMPKARRPRLSDASRPVVATRARRGR